MNVHTLIPNLCELMNAIQPDSIISRTFYKDSQMKAVLFGFDAGQSLSEHTSSHAAIIQILQGEATVTLGAETQEVSSGAWLHMPSRYKHSVYAKTPLVMLLLMMQGEGE
jgi:quercetin dioxygenase-like cupin family protein